MMGLTTSSGDAKVGQSQVLLLDEDIRRLNIAVDDAFVMARCKGLEELYSIRVD